MIDCCSHSAAPMLLGSSTAHYRKRMRAEKRFRWYGRSALFFAIAMLLWLLGSMANNALQGFFESRVRLAIHINGEPLGVATLEEAQALPPGAFEPLVQQALVARFPEAVERADRRALFELISNDAGEAVYKALKNHPEYWGQKVPLFVMAGTPANLFLQGKVDASVPEWERGVSDKQLAWLQQLHQEGALERSFSSTFFTQGDSRAPEQAGFLGAMLGSFFTLSVCIALALPVGVMAAVYLQEFARQGGFASLIEVNINNLAAVPSIVYGLLGLAVYLNFMHLPRSASVVGGMTLALMILPVIIIATRAALAAVPDSVRQAALALGATPLQMVLHHTLPLATPGIMTGTILGVARAIGETAPLLMIGMVAFVADIPSGFTSPATVMPVQIYLWASSPERAFAEKTAAGIMVLLVALLALNALAIYVRKRFEVRW